MVEKKARGRPQEAGMENKGLWKAFAPNNGWPPGGRVFRWVYHFPGLLIWSGSGGFWRAFWAFAAVRRQCGKSGKVLAGDFFFFCIGPWKVLTGLAFGLVWNWFNEFFPSGQKEKRRVVLKLKLQSSSAGEALVCNESMDWTGRMPQAKLDFDMLFDISHFRRENRIDFTTYALEKIGPKL